MNHASKFLNKINYSHLSPRQTFYIHFIVKARNVSRVCQFQIIQDIDRTCREKNILYIQNIFIHQRMEILSFINFKFWKGGNEPNFENPRNKFTSLSQVYNVIIKLLTYHMINKTHNNV